MSSGVQVLYRMVLMVIHIFQEMRPAVVLDLGRLRNYPEIR